MEEHIDTVGRRLLVSGRVQGVNFRLACARRANQLGLAGQVRNLADGRVEVIAAGPRSAVELLAAWCAEGPPLALVEEVESFARDPSGISGFRVVG